MDHMMPPTREPVDPPVQGAEYPKMLFRNGDCMTHMHVERGDTPMPMPVQGRHMVDTMIVHSLDMEMLALEEGWRLTADPNGSEAHGDARDAMIRDLQRQLAESNAVAEAAIDAVEEAVPVRRGPGRPRKEVIDG